MPGPSVIITRTGRRIFKDARGRFISAARYALELRRGPGGRFMSRPAAERFRNLEARLRAQLGPPPAGKQWALIATKYPDRFSDYTEGFEL